MNIKEIALKVKENKANEQKIKKKYADMEKSKKLTTTERLERIEELLKIV